MINELEDAFCELLKAGAKPIHVEMKMDDYNRFNFEFEKLNNQPGLRCASWRNVPIYKSVEVQHSCILALMGDFLVEAQLFTGKPYVYSESATAKMLGLNKPI